MSNIKCASCCKKSATCGSKTGGCNKKNTYDWLGEIEVPPSKQFDIVEVRFKGGRKDFYKNVDNLNVKMGDPVLVDVPSGHHIGIVSLKGELVRIQMEKKQIKNDENIRKIYRLATEYDLNQFELSRKREVPTLRIAKKIIEQENIDMKLNDVEFQADGSKATFFYTAEDRVDFRHLIKSFASNFNVKIDMRQINSRQESSRLGGIGSCGRELCCSTFLNDFKNVSTSSARYQNLSLNPLKLSGQCGRLKCCLNYELDNYLDALKAIPKVEKPIPTQNGNAFLVKTDIFRKILWFTLPNESNWVPVKAERVFELLELVKNGTIPFSLTENEEDMDRIENHLNDDLISLDKKYKRKKKKPSSMPSFDNKTDRRKNKFKARRNVVPTKSEKD